MRQSLGKVATPDDLIRIAQEQADAKEKSEAQKAKAEAARDAINAKYGGKGMILEVQVDKDGLPKESVTSADVAEMLKRAAGVAVASDDIELPEVTELGSVIAELKLHPAVGVSLKVVVEKSKITFS